MKGEMLKEGPRQSLRWDCLHTELSDEATVENGGGHLIRSRNGSLAPLIHVVFVLFKPKLSSLL